MKKSFIYIIVFFSGMVLATAILINFAYYNIHKEKRKCLIGPRVFGDIRIVPEKLPNAQEKMISLQKDGARFVVIIQDSNGVTKHVSTVNKANRSTNNSGGFMLEPLQTPGDWWCSYGCSLTGDKIKGELFVDLNFDSQFDTKYVYDNGKKKDTWIFVGDDWRKVVGANRQRAKDDSTTFRFDPNTGWLKNDANLISSDSAAVDANQK